MAIVDVHREHPSKHDTAFAITGAFRKRWRLISRWPR